MYKYIFGFALIASLVSSTYITTCHNDQECGSVCGTYGDDTVGPSEGLFGTKCYCQNGQSPTYRCNVDGINVYVCSDYQAPSCSIPCNQQICIYMNNKHSTATLRSACPKHHPVNTEQCCKYGGSYCTCIKQDTLDLNWKPYNELGGQNGYSSKATVGACGYANTGIDIRSPEALSYLALMKTPFCTAAPVVKTLPSSNESSHHHHHHHHSHADETESFHKSH